jgi:hypothetical protein
MKALSSIVHLNTAAGAGFLSDKAAVLWREIKETHSIRGHYSCTVTNKHLVKHVSFMVHVSNLTSL